MVEAAWERSVRQRLAEFQNPKLKYRSKPTPAVSPVAGHIVVLAVRKKRLGADHLFTHHSPSLSRLEAQIDAQRAARDAGWAIVGRVQSVTKH